MSGNADITAVIANFNYGAFLPRGGREPARAGRRRAADRRRRRRLDRARRRRGARARRRPPASTSCARTIAASARRATPASRASRTPYWLVLDADDRLAPGALAALRAALERDAGARLRVRLHAVLRRHGRRRALPRLRPLPAAVPAHDRPDRAGARARCSRRPAASTRRSPHYEDWELWVNALAHGYEGRRVDAVTLEYRRHAGTKFADDRRSYRRAWRGAAAQARRALRAPRASSPRAVARPRRPRAVPLVLGAAAGAGRRRGRAAPARVQARSQRPRARGRAPAAAARRRGSRGPAAGRRAG